MNRERAKELLPIIQAFKARPQTSAHTLGTVLGRKSSKDINQI